MEPPRELMEVDGSAAAAESEPGLPEARGQASPEHWSPVGQRRFLLVALSNRQTGKCGSGAMAPVDQVSLAVAAVVVTTGAAAAVASNQGHSKTVAVVVDLALSTQPKQ